MRQNGFMPRAIWSGTIAFGLVSIPVRMYSAIEEQKLHFHFLHRKDDSPIGYEKVCKKEGKPVPDKEITKAYSLLVRALEDSQLAAITKFVMRDRSRTSAAPGSPSSTRTPTRRRSAP